MLVYIIINRQKDKNSKGYIQGIRYEGDENLSVASVLEDINSNQNLKDLNHNIVSKIDWECSCNQKKCGACAMVINGIPRLACNSFLRDIVKDDHILRLEPLSKFQIIADLKVDRSILFHNMKVMNLWIEKSGDVIKQNQNMLHYQASKCLMCGCCLEVCPNFQPKSKFVGASIVPVTYGLLNQKELDQNASMIKKSYKKYFHSGCGNSLACNSVCPVKLPMEELLVRTNALALWRKY